MLIEHPLFTKLPRATVRKGVGYSRSRILMRYDRGIARASSASCLEEFFSETRSTEGSNLPHTYSAK